MYLKDSTIKNEVKKIHKLQKGTIYVFDNFIVSEFNEGVLVDLDCLTEVYYYLNAYSENKHGFGYISNRVHQYTVKVTDFMKTKILTQKIYPTAVVAYDEISKNTFKFEKQVNNCSAVLCESLDKAVIYLTGTLTNAC
jgi:hypothetical protein